MNIFVKIPIGCFNDDGSASLLRLSVELPLPDGKLQEKLISFAGEVEKVNLEVREFERLTKYISLIKLINDYVNKVEEANEFHKSSGINTPLEDFLTKALDDDEDT